MKVPQGVLIRLSNDQHNRISKSMRKFTPEKKLIAARKRCEKLKGIFDIKFEFANILFMNKNNIPYGITPQEMMNRILKKYVQMVSLGQAHPTQKTNLEMSEFAACYAIWYRSHQELQGEPQRKLLARLLTVILPVEKVTDQTPIPKVYNDLYRLANQIKPVNLQACRSKVIRYIDSIKRGEL